MKKTVFCLLTFLFLVVSCKQKEAPLSQAGKVWRFKLENGDVHVVNWKEYEGDDFKIKIPKSWEERKNSNIWKYFPYDNKDSKLYFSILKYDVAEIRMDIDDYLTEGFRQISSKIDKFHYTLKRLHFTNGTECYILTTFTHESGRNYITYSLIYQSQNLIFDFAYKTVNNVTVNEANYRQFLIIVQSLEFNHDMILDGTKFKVQNEETIKIGELINPKKKE